MRREDTSTVDTMINESDKTTICIDEKIIIFCDGRYCGYSGNANQYKTARELCITLKLFVPSLPVDNS